MFQPTVTFRVLVLIAVIAAVVHSVTEKVPGYAILLELSTFVLLATEVIVFRVVHILEVLTYLDKRSASFDSPEGRRDPKVP